MKQRWKGTTIEYEWKPRRTWCSKLRADDVVMFMNWSPVYKECIPDIGTILDVDHCHKTATIGYMEGYKYYIVVSSWDKLLAVYTKGEPVVHAKSIYGPSKLLISR